MELRLAQGTLQFRWLRKISVGVWLISTTTTTANYIYFPLLQVSQHHHEYSPTNIKRGSLPTRELYQALYV